MPSTPAFEQCNNTVFDLVAEQSNLSINAATETFEFFDSSGNLIDFKKEEMFDDGMHSDGLAGDGIYGCKISNCSNSLDYYLYADNDSAGVFSPVRAAYEYYTIQTTIKQGDLVINEVMSNNVSIVTDNSGKYEDWIELYNPGATSYSLDGFFLTDDFADPLKWKIPDGTLIESEGYLVIWADDYDETPGAIYIRPYWPWDDFTTQHYHTNFKLSKTGEQIGLFQGDQTESYTLIEEGSFWKYLDLKKLHVHCRLHAMKNLRLTRFFQVVYNLLIQT